MDGYIFKYAYQKQINSNMRDYPEKPATNLFQRDYGYREVSEILRWEWSTTFNQWGALVVFPDGRKVFTWPKKSFNYAEWAANRE